MSGVREQVERAIAEKGLLQVNEPVLVAVSGGLDSMVLLHLLARRVPSRARPLVIGHFNHQLRGQESEDDEQFVRQTAQGLGLRCQADRADVRGFAKRKRLSLETAARELRHSFLARTAASLGITKIALAHHADDQVELFFLRLFRGAGVEGLSGMKWISPSPAANQIQLIRPLLGMGKQDLEAFARDQKIRFRQDSSNAQLVHERNRIRHLLLPFIREQFQPALEKTLPRLMEILAAESELLRQLVSEIPEESGASLNRWPLALQRRWLHGACLRLGLTPDFDLVERLRLQPGTEFMVQPARIVRLDETGKLKVRSIQRSAFKGGQLLLDLAHEKGRATFSGLNLNWTIGRWRAAANRLPLPRPGTEQFDADKVGAKVHLRHWRPGDRYQPIGLKRGVKLQDAFTNLKIPRDQRRGLLIATTKSGDIFWVEGLRIAEAFKIATTTRRCLTWSWTRPSDS